MDTEEIVDSVEKLESTINRVREAQKEFANFSQEKVDEIFKAAAMAANQARIRLAKMAVVFWQGTHRTREETSHIIRKIY